MPLAEDNGDCDGWSKLLHWPGFSLIFNSFKYALRHRQNTRWWCARTPQVARVFGWRLSASHRTASADWPTYIVLAAVAHFHREKWFKHHERVFFQIQMVYLGISARASCLLCLIVMLLYWIKQVQRDFLECFLHLNVQQGQFYI